jgi:hypothetical protein
MAVVVFAAGAIGPGDEGWQSVWVDGYLPSLEFLVRDRARGMTYVRGVPIATWKQQNGSDQRALRDLLFMDSQDRQWYEHGHCNAPETPWYLYVNRGAKRRLPRIFEQWQYEGQPDDYRVLVAVRRSNDGTWNEVEARRSLDVSGFKVKEGGYANRAAFCEDAKRVLAAARAPYDMPCVVAESLMKDLGLMGGNIAVLDPSVKSDMRHREREFGLDWPTSFEQNA